jgi:hypothetical protein
MTHTAAQLGLDQSSADPNDSRATSGRFRPMAAMLGAERQQSKSSFAIALRPPP